MEGSFATRATTLRSSETSDQGHWVRREADQLLTDMPETPLLALASELEAKALVFDEGPQMAHEIASELRRRAAAGVRFWPSPTLVKEEPSL